MRFPRITSYPVFAMFVLSSIWLALVVLAPYMVPAGTLEDLSGRVGYHDNDALFADLDPLPRLIYWIGDAQCHQIAERSYFLNGNEMPFCARDLGLFLGVAIGFGVVSFFRYKINPLFVLLGLVPMGIDGGAQLLTDYESNNTLRMITGVIAGVVLSMMIAHFMFVLQEDREKARKKKELEGKPGEE